MSKIIEAMTETAHDLHDAGVMDEVTMREFDAMALPPVKQYTAVQIKRIRTRNKVSQPVFAKFLNASPSTIKSWEQGDKHPRGATLRLLEIVERQGLAALVS